MSEDVGGGEEAEGVAESVSVSQCLIMHIPHARTGKVNVNDEMRQPCSYHAHTGRALPPLPPPLPPSLVPPTSLLSLYSFCRAPLSPPSSLHASYQPSVSVFLLQSTPLVAVDPLPIRVGLTQHLEGGGGVRGLLGKPREEGGGVKVEGGE